MTGGAGGSWRQEGGGSEVCLEGIVIILIERRTLVSTTDRQRRVSLLYVEMIVLQIIPGTSPSCHHAGGSDVKEGGSRPGQMFGKVTVPKVTLTFYAGCVGDRGPDG